MKERKIYKYTAIFEPAEEGGYVVRIPVLDGLITQGETLNEAKYMAKDAIQCYLESLVEDGLPIPEEKEKIKPVMKKLEINFVPA